MLFICATSCHLAKYPVIHKDPAFLKLVRSAGNAVNKYGLSADKLHVNEHPFLRTDKYEVDTDRIVWNKSPDLTAFIDPSKIAWHGCTVDCQPPGTHVRCENQKQYKFQKRRNGSGRKKPQSTGNVVNFEQNQGQNQARNIPEHQNLNSQGNQANYQYQNLTDANYTRVGLIRGGTQACISKKPVYFLLSFRDIKLP